MTWPFIYVARVDARKAARWATSSGLPKRRIGMVCLKYAVRSGESAFVASVSIRPGEMQFAVIKPRRPYSAVIDFVADTSAPFDAAYADMAASPVVSAMDVMLIILPYLFLSIWGRASLASWYGTSKFTCIMCCKCSGVVSASIFMSIIPALFIKMSMRLNFSVT